MSSPRSVLLAALALLLLGTAAHAQATRTWVSGVGDDVNPCSRTAPCKSFAGALPKTAAGGVISVLDPGGFGGVTITKSISIEGDGSNASILVTAGTNGIVINALANDVVVIRNVRIEGANTGFNGIRFLAGKALHVEDCTINGFNATMGTGIDFQPNGASQLFVRDTTIRNNSSLASTNGGGILIKPTATGSATAELDNVRFDRNRFGIRVEDRGKVTISNSVFANNAPNNAVLVQTVAQPGSAHVENTVLANNDTAIKSDGINSTIRLSNATIVDNATGILVANGGAVVSFQNNRNAGNLTPGAPTGTAGPQ